MKKRKYKLSGKMIDSDISKFYRYLKENSTEYYTGKILTPEEVAYRMGFIEGFLGGRYDRYDKMNKYTHKRFLNK